MCELRIIPRSLPRTGHLTQPYAAPKGCGGGRRPPTRGRPREPRPRRTPKTTRSRRPSRRRHRATSPAWLAAHFENVARRPQPTSERPGYETCASSPRATPTPRTGGEPRSATAATPAACSCRRAWTRGSRSRARSARSSGSAGARRRRPDARAAAARGRDRGRAAVFGLALTCADLEPVDNAAIEADDEQRPDVDADGHVSALLRASGRATPRAAPPRRSTSTNPAAAPRTRTPVCSAWTWPRCGRLPPRSRRPRPPARRIPRRRRRRATPAPAPGRPAGAPDAAELAPAPPDAADAGPAAAAPAAAPRDAPGPADARPGRADARDGGAPRRGAARGRGGRGGRGRGVALPPAAPGHARRPRSSRARGRRPRAGPSGSRAPAAGPISIPPLAPTTRGSARRPSPRPRRRPSSGNGRRPRRRRLRAGPAGARADGRLWPRSGSLAAPELAPTAALWRAGQRPRSAVPMPPPTRPEPAARRGATAARRWPWAATPRPDAPWVAVASATRREVVGQDEKRRASR